MAINSKIKGKIGELEWAHYLEDKFGIKARRGQQYSGSPDSPDVVSDLVGVHWEVKRVERLNVLEAFSQASKDCHGFYIPALAHRANRSPWLITISAKDMGLFATEFYNTINKKI